MQLKRGLILLIIAILGVIWGFIPETRVESRLEQRERIGNPSAIEEAAPKQAQSELPLWSSTRSQSARENAEAHWRKHRREFPEYRSAEEYIAGAHQFLRGPPPGTLFKSRDNGDRLFYDPATNTFAVQARNGAPRTMFRPDKGLQYWKRQ